MTASMHALTIWQPWASLIAEGLKPLEFRGHPAPRRLIGQRIAIHAGARRLRRDEVAELIDKLASADWRETGLSDRAKALDLLERIWRRINLRTTLGDLPHSHMVCTAILGEPIRNEVLAERLGLPWMNDSDRPEHSNWGWPLTEVERLEPPVPARGAQGFWPWVRQ